MGERTIVKTVELPYGQRWEWFPDLNVVGLAQGMSEQEREEALSEVQAHWRRSCLRVVTSGMAAASIFGMCLEAAGPLLRFTSAVV